ncbi:MAG: insulinase family protein [Myxococcota bacterium]
MVGFVSAALAAGQPVVENQAWCFGSGLRVIFEEDHARPEIRITTVIEGGSAGETGADRGVAHLAEHLWFRSTPEGAGGDVWSAVGNQGGRLNGATTRDRTEFTTVVPRKALETALLLEAARL